MKIIDSRPKEIDARDVNMGMTFIFDDHFYIMSDREEVTGSIAVNLFNGASYSFDGTERVELVSAEVTISL